MPTLSLLLALSAAHAEPLLIGGGTVQVGGPGSQEPQREVVLEAFRIDRTEVTVEAFEAFVASGGYDDAAHWSKEGRAWLRTGARGAGPRARASGRTGDHPVVAVTFHEAEAYCRAQGGRLPTGPEWERAACGGGDGPFPWGEQEDFRATWYGQGKHGAVKSVATSPAAELDPALASPDGLLHVVGNVWEWTAEPWTQGSSLRTLRGGSYMNLPSYCTCTHREPAPPTEVRLTVGFRCAYSP